MEISQSTPFTHACLVQRRIPQSTEEPRGLGSKIGFYRQPTSLQVSLCYSPELLPTQKACTLPWNTAPQSAQLSSCKVTSIIPTVQRFSNYKAIILFWFLFECLHGQHLFLFLGYTVSLWNISNIQVFPKVHVKVKLKGNFILVQKTKGFWNPFRVFPDMFSIHVLETFQLRVRVCVYTNGLMDDHCSICDFFFLSTVLMKYSPSRNIAHTAFWKSLWKQIISSFQAWQHLGCLEITVKPSGASFQGQMVFWSLLYLPLSQKWGAREVMLTLNHIFFIYSSDCFSI